MENNELQSHDEHGYSISIDSIAKSCCFQEEEKKIFDKKSKLNIRAFEQYSLIFHGVLIAQQGKKHVSISSFSSRGGRIGKCWQVQATVEFER